MAGATSIEQAIIDAHALVFKAAIDSFKEDALRVLRPTIGCDTAIWASGEADSGRIYSIATLDYPLNQLVSYAQQWQAQDFVRAAATASPGRAIRNEDVMARKAYCETAIYRLYSRPAGIEHALGIVDLDPISRIGEMLFLFRSDPEAYYTGSDCRRLEQLLPHFTMAWRHRQLLHALEQHTQAGSIEATSAIAHAIVDESGQIHAAEPRFGQMLREAVPQWSGPLLPPALTAALASRAPFIDIGSLRITVRRRQRIVLGISRHNNLPALTAAEWRVAQGYARGESATALATRFGVSPRTVRNQLAALYRKLDVHDRLELIARLRQLGHGID